MNPGDPTRAARPGGPDEVDALPLPQRAEAYLAAHEALQERLGLGGP